MTSRQALCASRDKAGVLEILIVTDTGVLQSHDNGATLTELNSRHQNPHQDPHPTGGTTQMKYALRTLALPTALAATLVLTGCGTADTSSHNDTKASGSAASGTTASKASTAKNDADFVFATMMIPHHAQAIVMADMALKQTTNPKVLALATKITAAQSPEIQRMSSWLKGWGKPVPGTTAGSGMAGMSGMGGQAGGMMSEQEIANLGRATGSGFDRMWLQMMVKHHQGALDMAKTALAQAANPDTKKLATSIIAGQSAEIAEMNTILAQIPA